MTFSVQQVAEQLGVSPSTVGTWIRNGELKAFSVSRSPMSKKPRLRITSEALAEFQRRRDAGPTPQEPRRRRAEDVIQFYT
jgi:excisionase family DNA binding protein